MSNWDQHGHSSDRLGKYRKMQEYRQILDSQIREKHSGAPAKSRPDRPREDLSFTPHRYNASTTPRDRKLIQRSTFLPSLISRQKPYRGTHERRHTYGNDDDEDYSFSAGRTQSSAMECINDCESIIENLKHLTRISTKKVNNKKAVSLARHIHDEYPSKLAEQPVNYFQSRQNYPSEDRKMSKLNLKSSGKKSNRQNSARGSQKNSNFDDSYQQSVRQSNQYQAPNKSVNKQHVIDDPIDEESLEGRQNLLGDSIVDMESININSSNEMEKELVLGGSEQKGQAAESKPQEHHKAGKKPQEKIKDEQKQPSSEGRNQSGQASTTADQNQGSSKKTGLNIIKKKQAIFLKYLTNAKNRGGILRDRIVEHKTKEMSTGKSKVIVNLSALREQKSDINQQQQSDQQQQKEKNESSQLTKIQKQIENNKQVPSKTNAQRQSQNSNLNNTPQQPNQQE